MDVIFLQRKPADNQVSIERLFDDIRSSLSGRFCATVHVSPFFSTGLWSRLRNAITARRAVGRRICHITGDVHFLALAVPRGKLVLTIHDCAVLHRMKGCRRELVRRVWFDWPARRAAVVTAISEATKEDLRQWISPEAFRKIRVIPNCVSKNLGPEPKTFNRERPAFLQVGTKWNKNLERIVEALVGMDCKLEIIGEISAAQTELLQASGISFTALGKVSEGDLLAAYRRCDAVIFASLFEGFGMPIIEAQAIGRPVITSHRSSMPEAAGSGALYVDPESVESIREGVQRLVTEPGLAEALVAKGFENVKRFDAKTIVQQYEQIYGELDEGRETQKR